MSFFKNISDFFQSIFMASSPEVKQKQALKKLASDLKNTDPQIYRDGSVLPPFADALKIMFENTKPIMDILSDTICTTDLERNHRFTEQLLLTGFPEEIQEILLSLTYEKRKERAREAESISRFFESEHRQLENSSDLVPDTQEPSPTVMVKKSRPGRAAFCALSESSLPQCPSAL